MEIVDITTYCTRPQINKICMYVCMYVCCNIVWQRLTLIGTTLIRKKKLCVVDDNAFGLSFRQADHWLASRLFWPEIEYMPTSNCSLHKNEDFQPQSFKVATILKQQRGEKWWSGWDWFSHSYAVNNLKLTYIPFLSGFGFSREYGRFNQVGQVSPLIPWQKLDSHQIF